MAENPRDYRDPKVTRRRGMNRGWLIVATVVVLILLAWLFFFPDDAELDEAEVEAAGLALPVSARTLT